MAASLEIATDEILDTITDAWAAGIGAASGASPLPELLYEIRDGDSEPTSNYSNPWGRVTVRHAAAQQYALASDTGACLFENSGFAVVQIFTPRAQKNGATIAGRMATVVRNALQGKRTANVWFKNVTLAEQSRDGPWNQVNCTAQFTWVERI
jgi:hypothetical protein